MSSSSIPTPWRVADVTLIEIEIRHPSDRQMRVEFGCGLRLVITDTTQIPLAVALIESLRSGKEPPPMICFPTGVRVHRALEAHDLRKSFNGLTAIASRGLEIGALFVFTNKCRNRLKILYYDRTGACVLAKRLEKRTFSWPPPSKAGAAALSLAPEALHLLLDGIDLRGAQMRPWYERD
jgi:transposase